MITRIGTALLVGPISLVAMVVGGWVLAAGVMIISFFVSSEVLKMALPPSKRWPVWLGIGIVLLAIASTQFEAARVIWNSPILKFLGIGAVVFQVAELLMGRPWFPRNWMFRWVKVVTILCLIFPYFCLMRSLYSGWVLLMFVCLVAWFGDTGAYFAGKKWGRRPLAPRISPGKTVEGAIGGFVVSVVFAAIYALCLGLPVALFIAYGAGFAVLGQVGDLHESLVKRFFKVKDSSRLLPGHGGMYDRTDSTHLLIAVGYYFLRF